MLWPQVAATKSSYTNVTVLKDWMSGMGEGASANGIGVLYCCAEPNIHMNGVTVPAAYAVRSSPDYVWGPSGKKGAPIELPTGMHFISIAATVCRQCAFVAL